MGKNNDKSLQEQIAHLNNELEELRLEKEESKKNVLHFMQEADSARHELKLLRQQVVEKDKAGCLSPPPEKQEEEIVDDTITVLISRIHCLDKEKLNALFNHVEMIQQGQSELPIIDKLTLQLKETHESLKLSKEKNQQLEDTIKQYKLKENKQQEDQKQQQQQQQQQQRVLKDELEQYKQAKSKELLLLQDRCNKFQEESEIHKKEHSKTQEQFKTLQDKYSQLSKHDNVKDQTYELEQAKIRENHLKIINRTLRDELRKPAPKMQEESPLNIEYLRNVIIKFLEKRNARAQLVPVISMLLQCGQEDQLRLSRIIIKAK